MIHDLKMIAVISDLFQLRAAQCSHYVVRTWALTYIRVTLMLFQIT